MRYMVRWLILVVAILAAPASTVNVANAQTAKITSLTAIADTAIASDDVLYLIDISSVGTEDKKVTIEELSQVAFSQRLFESEVSATTGQQILTNPDHNSIAGGNHNCIVGGGYQSFENVISGTNNLRFIYGGYENEIGPALANGIYGSFHSGIMDADGSSTVTSRDGTMPNGGGQTRTVAAGLGHGFIQGGSTNFIDSPAYNYILGGQYNEIIGAYSQHGGIVGGDHNTIDASSHNSVIGGGIHNYIQSGIVTAYVEVGRSAVAYNDNQHVRGAGYFTERGDAQVSRYIFRRDVAAGVTEHLRTSHAATAESIALSSSGIFTIPDTRTIYIKAHIVAITDDSAERWAADFTALVSSNGSTITIHSQTLDEYVEDDTEWDFVIGSSGTTLNLSFDGDDSKVTNVVAEITVVEVGDGT